MAFAFFASLAINIILAILLHKAQASATECRRELNQEKNITFQLKQDATSTAMNFKRRPQEQVWGEL